MRPPTMVLIGPNTVIQTRCALAMDLLNGFFKITDIDKFWGHTSMVYSSKMIF
jgi:hypothetical protein